MLAQRPIEVRSGRSARAVVRLRWGAELPLETRVEAAEQDGVVKPAHGLDRLDETERIRPRRLAEDRQPGLGGGQLGVRVDVEVVSAHPVEGDSLGVQTARSAEFVAHDLSVVWSLDPEGATGLVQHVPQLRASPIEAEVLATSSLGIPQDGPAGAARCAG